MRPVSQFTAFSLLLATPVFAQAGPPPGAFRFGEASAPDPKGEIALYPGNAPGTPTDAKPEQWITINGDLVVHNVVRPTITPVLPDPARVGVIGFSAGAMTVLDATLANAPDVRPVFAATIYPPMNHVAVPAEAAPLFVAIASDDPLFGGRGFGLVQALQAAHRPVELHYCERGDHGFATGRPGTTTMLVMDEFHAWLAARGVLGTAK